MTIYTNGDDITYRKSRPLRWHVKNAIQWTVTVLAVVWLAHACLVFEGVIGPKAGAAACAESAR